MPTATTERRSSGQQPSLRLSSLAALSSMLLLMTAIFARPVMSWEFAVTTSNKIIFYDGAWRTVTSAAHQFADPSAIAYDETDDTLYFNDRAHHNGSIFSLRLSASDHQSHRVDRLVAKTDGERIQGIAFDPLERTLYWTDAIHRNIMRMPLNRTAAGAVDETANATANVTSARDHIWLRSNGTAKPQGIAVDACRRKVYWSTWSSQDGSTIRRAALDGTKNEVIVSRGLDMPLGIVVDQYSRRLYWVDDLQGVHYSVESAALDGTARRTLVRDLDNAPQNLAVDQDTVYWTDETYRSVWKVAKNATDGKPEKVLAYATPPNGIIVRDQLLSKQALNVECAKTIEQIKSNLQLVESPSVGGASASTGTAGAANASAAVDASVSAGATAAVVQNFCLNGGLLNVKTNSCICTVEYKGHMCELPVCHNYCVQGQCHVSTTGYAQCTCPEGFAGDRCERDVCTAFCLNGGRCAVEEESGGAAVCHCVGAFSGRRCERMNEAEVCRRYCDDGEELDGFRMRDLCGNCSATNATIESLVDVNKVLVPVAPVAPLACNQTTPAAEATSSPLNKTAIFVTVGVVCSLGLVFLIVNALRRFYKPIRPRIKKTFVVRNKMDRKNRTPLTCRPAAPEQCEITIENCCNMNICDTPCFDPKTLQQEMNKETARKEDKYKLLSNMDGDLY